jgi:hypothetical protein
MFRSHRSRNISNLSGAVVGFFAAEIGMMVAVEFAVMVIARLPSIAAGGILALVVMPVAALWLQN